MSHWLRDAVREAGGGKRVQRAVTSRRRFVRQLGGAAAALVIGSQWMCRPRRPEATQPVIVIVGGGIAGLYAAYLLQRRGLTATVYEGSPRAGGRILTAYDMVGDGLYTEMGGEFIDANHSDMLFLCREFNLALDDRQPDYDAGMKEYCFYLEGRHIGKEELRRALEPYGRQIMKDVTSISPEITFEKHTATDRQFDEMSLADYLSRLGMGGWLRELFRLCYVAEYGLEAEEQSAINLLALFAEDERGGYELYGSSDERFTIRGGNQRLIEALEKRLTGQVQYEHILVAVQEGHSGYRLTFRQPSGATADVDADVVVLTLPFTCLREVDLKLPLPAWKKRAIAELGYGQNAKLFAGCGERVWRQQGYAGYAFADNGIINGYDHTHMQGSNRGTGGYTIFLGGREGVQCNEPTLEQLRDRYVPKLDALFRGFEKNYNQVFQRWHWPSYRFARASYVCYRPGQYTTLSGAVEKPVGNLYFAGEHCNYAFQGFMNGAALSARQVANAIVEKVGR